MSDNTHECFIAPDTCTHNDHANHSFSCGSTRACFLSLHTECSSVTHSKSGCTCTGKFHASHPLFAITLGLWSTASRAAISVRKPVRAPQRRVGLRPALAPKQMQVRIVASQQAQTARYRCRPRDVVSTCSRSSAAGGSPPRACAVRPSQPLSAAACHRRATSWR